jgi:hypothetical protein
MQLEKRSAISIKLSAFGCRWSVISYQLSVSVPESREDAYSQPTFILHPSSFILHPSSFILHPSSFILHPSAFILHPSAFILLPSSFCLHPSAFCPLPAPIATLDTCNVAQKVVRKQPAVTKSTAKQAPNERGASADGAEVQRLIDFCATLQTLRRRE